MNPKNGYDSLMDVDMDPWGSKLIVYSSDQLVPSKWSFPPKNISKRSPLPKHNFLYKIMWSCLDVSNISRKNRHITRMDQEKKIPFFIQFSTEIVIFGDIGFG